jgi:ParB-like chromosome segregation protein Spo0J
MRAPPLKLLHAEDSLSQVKLDLYRKVSTESLERSLQPGQTGSLKVRPDDTVIDGHHRLTILRERGVEVDSLPREIIEKE